MKQRKIKATIGIGISILFIWLAFKGADWSEIIRISHNINYFFIIAAMAMMVCSVWIRAIRWRILISKVGNVSTKDLYKVTMVGYMGNNILPFKMGELLRAYAISRKQNIVFSGALSSLVVERVIDVISFIFIITVVFSIFPITDWAQKVAVIGLLIVISFLILSLFLFRYNNKFENWYLKMQRQFIAKDKETVANHFVVFCRGIEFLWQNPKPWQTIILSLLLWAMYFISTVLSIYAFDFNLGILDILKTGMLLLTFLTLAVIIPSAPGYIGTFHAMSIAALQIAHIDLNAAQAFAIIYFIAQYIPLTFIGLYYFFKLNLHVADLDNI